MNILKNIKINIILNFKRGYNEIWYNLKRTLYLSVDTVEKVSCKNIEDIKLFLKVLSIIILNR